jgi:ssDNA-binding Zn-finger/Zn-ribbon topoisomerase 1
MKLPNREEIKKAIDNVRAVHDCPKCQAYLNLIKEHQKLNHKDDKDASQ